FTLTLLALDPASRDATVRWLAAPSLPATPAGEVRPETLAEVPWPGAAARLLLLHLPDAAADPALRARLLLETDAFLLAGPDGPAPAAGEVLRQLLDGGPAVWLVLRGPASPSLATAPEWAAPLRGNHVAILYLHDGVPPPAELTDAASPLRSLVSTLNQARRLLPA